MTADSSTWQEVISAVTFDERGLVPAIAQDALTGEVRMLAFMSRESLRATLDTGLVHFFSRSRGTVWKKGGSSGHTLTVRRLLLDCDGDCLLVLVDPAGPTCHTGAPSCFARVSARDGWRAADAPLPAASELSATIERRRDAPDDGPPSYTRSLLAGGAVALGDKLREEADELARAVAGESLDRVVSESVDVIYHLMVALASRGASWRVVLAEMARRAGRSGLDEKADRGGPGGSRSVPESDSFES